MGHTSFWHMPLTNINPMKRHTEAPLDASMEVHLVVDMERTRTKHMLKSFHLNACQNPNTKIDNRSHKNVAKFKRLGTQNSDFHS
jgi:hypothetical protein